MRFGASEFFLRFYVGGEVIDYSHYETVAKRSRDAKQTIDDVLPQGKSDKLQNLRVSESNKACLSYAEREQFL